MGQVVPVLELNSRESLLKRAALLLECRDDPVKQGHQLALCAQDILYWIDNFCITYDPRLVTQGLPAYVPFDLFPRQREFLTWVDGLVAGGNEGLCEKVRGAGFTWLMGAYAGHRWLFHPGFLTSFGSRKEELVDKMGDTKAIFPKMRLLLYRLPEWMMPLGFERKKHDLHLRLINPSNGNTVTGEAGDNMGRGGRSSLYIVDEAAHIDHADSVEAAIADNADAKVWGSTPNTLGDTFGKKRFSGQLRPEQIFTFQLSDDPRRTPDWEQKRKAELAATPWIWAREYGLDYTATVEDICIPAAWVQASVELGKRKLWDPTEFDCISGLDVGDGGGGLSVYQPRRGPFITPARSWTRPDTTLTAIEAAKLAAADGAMCLFYDEIGVGRGVLSTMAHLDELTDDPRLAKLVTKGINVGRAAPWQVVWPDGQTSKRKFANLKAHLWFVARERFHASWEHLRFLDGDEGGVEHEPDELFVFLPAPPIADEGFRDPYRELIIQISIPRKLERTDGKIIMESKQQLANRNIASPDRAEALMLSLSPLDLTALGRGESPPPTVAKQERGWPELEGGVVPSDFKGFDPAVKTGHRFDKDFMRDW